MKNGKLIDKFETIKYYLNSKCYQEDVTLNGEKLMNVFCLNIELMKVLKYKKGK